MSQRLASRGHVLRAAVLLCLAACLMGCASAAENPRQARSGTWDGDTEFGHFSFTVCEGGGKITHYMLEYRVGESSMLSQGSSGESLIDDQNAFDLSTPEAGITFRGQFSEDGKSVTGVWEVTADGETVSEEWALER